MLPTYQPGDIVLGWRWFRPRAGQVVVAHHERPLIKRIIRIDTGGIWLEGDNVGHSTDSRQFGALPPFRLEARVLCRVMHIA